MTMWSRSGATPWRLIAALLMASLLLPGGTLLAAVDDPAAAVTGQLATLVESRVRLPADAAGQTLVPLHPEVAEFYRGRAFRPLWVVNGSLRPSASHLVEQLRAAAEHGLCGEDYLLLAIERYLDYRSALRRRGEPLPANEAAVLDLLLTQGFFGYATHLVEGQVDPALAHVDWRARRRKLELTRLLPPAVEGDSVGRLLVELAPPHAEYRALMAALAHYRTLAARGGWPAVPEGESLRPGVIDPRLPALRARLLVSGDLAAPLPYEGNAYGPGTLEAVRRFQRRHGLEGDGVIGKRTYQALNVSVEARIRQIELNLERWRWLPRDLGRRHIRINIAAYHLDVIDNGQPVLSMPVIVGTPYRRTPVFSANMTYLEFAPTWTVPPTILREDKLPAIRKNPGYLAANHFQILRAGRVLSAEEVAAINWRKVEAASFPGELRMTPGPWNPLGRVKFMFPNQFNVYLHDTNERGLFSRERRTFSSGCIRIEKPVELARYLLQGVKGWDEERLQQALARSSPLQVGIEPVPTHIQYWTAWVNGEGGVQLRFDLYHRDLDLEVAIYHHPPGSRDAFLQNHPPAKARLVGAVN